MLDQSQGLKWRRLRSQYEPTKGSFWLHERSETSSFFYPVRFLFLHARVVVQERITYMEWRDREEKWKREISRRATRGLYKNVHSRKKSALNSSVLNDTVLNVLNECAALRNRSSIRTTTHKPTQRPLRRLKKEYVSHSMAVSVHLVPSAPLSSCFFLDSRYLSRTTYSKSTYPFFSPPLTSPWPIPLLSFWRLAVRSTIGRTNGHSSGTSLTLLA